MVTVTTDWLNTYLHFILVVLRCTQGSNELYLVHVRERYLPLVCDEIPLND